MNSQDLEPSLRMIWIRYENMIFVLIFSVILCALGFVIIRAVPLLAIALELIGFFTAYFFWWRYYLTPCPKCGQRFVSFWGKRMFALSPPTKCQNCGLSAGISPK